MFILMSAQHFNLFLKISYFWEIYFKILSKLFGLGKYFILEHLYRILGCDQQDPGCRGGSFIISLLRQKHHPRVVI